MFWSVFASPLQSHDIFILVVSFFQFWGIKGTLVADKRVPGFKFRRKLAQRAGQHVPVQGWSDVQVHGFLALRRHLGGGPAQKLIENHASVFLKFLEFLEDAPHPPKTPNKILHYWFGIWGPCVRYNSVCLISWINYPIGKTGTKILSHSSKDLSLGIPCSDQSLCHLCNHMSCSFWFSAPSSSEESRKL